MARNRQRAKERQAKRRASGAPGRPAPPPRAAEAAGTGHGRTPTEEAALEAGAPVEDLGRSDETLDLEQDIDAAEGEHFDPAEDQPEDGSGTPTARAGGRRASKRPRLVQFLVAVWAELQRVEWPDRQQLTTLTGVVLGFVLIAGGYLGLLDAVASKLVNAIL